MDDDHAREFGRYMAEARAIRGLSARALSDITNINDATIVRIENGKISAPAADKLAAIAEALGLPVADVFARAGYASTKDLPGVTPYMRTKFKGLPEDAAKKIEKYARSIAAQHGIDADGPAEGEDEAP